MTSAGGRGIRRPKSTGFGLMQICFQNVGSPVASCMTLGKL